MKFVSVFMDVEDPINPLSDDAALDFAKLFTAAGVRGSFCLTGEKCRTLLARDRQDVLSEYKPHCLGLHTNTHSFHPTTMELLAGLSYEDGCEAALDAESRGFESFQIAFDRHPTFWGGAGNTWSPEITDGLKRLGMPAYVYALTQFPNQAVHLFNGVVGLPQALSISELDWADDARAEARSADVLQAIQDIPQPWIGVFVGHPTKFRYTQYWDTPYFSGRTPPSPEFTEPHPFEVYERAKANLRRFLARVRDQVEVIGVDQMLKMPWEFREPTASELDSFREETTKNLRGAIQWPVHRPNLNPELIVQKTMDLADTARIGFLG